ncbi:hypothetical protein O5282_18295 [Escherichia coli]|nr:hypothetical protein [Escherichia coli]
MANRQENNIIAEIGYGHNFLKGARFPLKGISLKPPAITERDNNAEANIHGLMSRKIESAGNGKKHVLSTKMKPILIENLVRWKLVEPERVK